MPLRRLLPVVAGVGFDSAIPARAAPLLYKLQGIKMNTSEKADLEFVGVI